MRTHKSKNDTNWNSLLKPIRKSICISKYEDIVLNRSTNILLLQPI